MKTLLFYFILFFSLFSMGQAQETKWVAKGPFWEHPDTISNIQFTPEGDYFFVLDKVNLKFFKYKTDSGILANHYDIRKFKEFDNVKNNYLQIKLSPECKTYTISSLFSSVLYLIDLEMDTIITSRHINLNYDTNFTSNPFNPNPEVYPFCSFSFKNYLIYQQPWSGLHYTTGGYFYGENSSEIILVNLITGDSIYYNKPGNSVPGIESCLLTNNENELCFIQSYRYYNGNMNTIFEDYRIYTYSIFHLGKLNIEKFGSLKVPTSKFHVLYKISKTGAIFFDYVFDEDYFVMYRTDTLNTFDLFYLSDKIDNFDIINSDFLATVHRDSISWLNIYRFNPKKEFIESINLQELKYYYQMVTHPMKSEIYFIKDRSVLQKIDLSEYDKYVDVKQNNENQNLENISIFPNPTTYFITIDSPSIKRGSGGVLSEIVIYDVFGRCVLSVETQCIASLQRIDISTLPVGVYFVRIGEKVEKFVKI